MQKLEKAGIPTPLRPGVKRPGYPGQAGGDCSLEVIIRNVAAGSFSKRFGVAEGTALAIPTIEFSYKNDDLHDPMINRFHALALEPGHRPRAGPDYRYGLPINDILRQILLAANIRLIDFKLEFGRLPDGTIILADEISPDTCRFWTPPPARTWIRICSAGTWGARRTPTRK